MKKHLLTKDVAKCAISYYMANNDANFFDTACYVSEKFKANYSRSDIGKMFRHIVIFGNNDNTAKLLVWRINVQTEHQIYNKYLKYRFEYPRICCIIKQYETLESKAEKFKSLHMEDYIFSSDEKELMENYQDLEKCYNTFLQEDHLEIDLARKRKKEIEKHKLESLK